jgi:hypothetical protein
MTCGVVLFHTNSAALRAEKVLQRAGLVVKLIPTPREFSSDCGIALRFEWQDAARVQQLLDAARVERASIEPMGG